MEKSRSAPLRLVNLVAHHSYSFLVVEKPRTVPLAPHGLVPWEGSESSVTYDDQDSTSNGTSPLGNKEPKTFNQQRLPLRVFSCSSWFILTPPSFSLYPSGSRRPTPRAWLTALAARQAEPPSGLQLHRSLPRTFPGAWLTPLPPGSRAAPLGLRLHRSLPHLSPAVWFSFQVSGFRFHPFSPDPPSPPASQDPPIWHSTLDLSIDATSSRKPWRPVGATFGSLPRTFPGACLTALAARQAVPPSGLQLHRSLPRTFPGSWFSTQEVLQPFRRLQVSWSSGA